MNLLISSQKVLDKLMTLKILVEYITVTHELLCVKNHL